MVGQEGAVVAPRGRARAWQRILAIRWRHQQRRLGPLERVVVVEVEVVVVIVVVGQSMVMVVVEVMVRKRVRLKMLAGGVGDGCAWLELD